MLLGDCMGQPRGPGRNLKACWQNLLCLAHRPWNERHAETGLKQEPPAVKTREAPGKVSLSSKL